MAKKEMEKKKKALEEKEINKAKVKEDKKELKEKKEKKVKEKKTKKDGFFKSVAKEMKQVKWPTGKEMVRYVIATIVFVVVLALFFQLTDLLSSFVKGLF